VVIRNPNRPVVLTTAERRALEAWAQGNATPHRMALRARLVLACANGRSNRQVAQALGLDADTVARWRARFLEHRVAGLQDGRRAGAPRRMKVAELESLLTAALLSKPAGGGRWTTRGLAESCGLSQSAVSRALRGLGLELSGPGRANARARDLLQLHLAPRAGSTPLVHRVRTLPALRDWLAACDAEVGPSGRGDLILLDAGRTAASEASRWQRERPRFAIYLAPKGRLWPEIISHWFPTTVSVLTATG